MPTYVYKFVKTGETIEVQQSFSDATLTEYVHPGSGKKLAVKKVFQPVGVTFKGSGFFKNDNRNSTSSTTPSGSSNDSSSSASSDSKSTDSTSSDSKTSSSDSKSSDASKPVKKTEAKPKKSSANTSD